MAKTFDWAKAKVLDAMKSFQESGTFTDVTFVCADGTVEAHKAALARHSDLFQEVFGEDASAATFLLPDEAAADVSCLLQILYTGQVNVDSPAQVEALHALCHDLGVLIPLQIFPVARRTAKRRAEQEEKGSDSSKKRKKERHGCPHCKSSFALRSTLDFHVRQKHSKATLSDDDDGENDDDVEDYDALVVTVDPEDVLRTDDVPVLHIEDDDVPCLVSDEDPVVNVTAKKTPCPTCNKPFTNNKIREHLASSHLNMSLRYYVNEDKTCKLCSYSSKSGGFASVARHVGLAHNGIDEFADPAQRAWMDSVKRNL